jgi:SNF2 family DNA or RNA helicase
VQTIALLCYLMEKKGDHGPFMEYHGSPPERNQLWKDTVSSRKFNVLLTTYEYVLAKRDRTRLESIEWHYIVRDFSVCDLILY